MVYKVTHKDYVQHSVHNNYMNCKKIIDCGFENQFWTRKAKYNTNLAKKWNYTCKGFKEYPKRLLVLLDPDSQNATIFISTDNHDHAQKVNSRLDSISKAKVEELFVIIVWFFFKLRKKIFSFIFIALIWY